MSLEFRGCRRPGLCWLLHSERYAVCVLVATVVEGQPVGLGKWVRLTHFWLCSPLPGRSRGLLTWISG